MNNVKFKIKMYLINGVLRLVMEVELSNFELTSWMLEGSLGIVGLEVHAWLSTTCIVFAELDSIV
jgi:hypothetical protein